ncbi:MAG: Mur ligase domain-containing protein [Thermoanaerobaculia bacterium]
MDLVVVSSAIAAGNPEVAEARARSIPVVRRAEMLAELMRMKYGIAIAGTHGKTTTTSLVGAIMTEAGLDPTVIVGGRLRVSGPSRSNLTTWSSRLTSSIAVSCRSLGAGGDHQRRSRPPSTPTRSSRRSRMPSSLSPAGFRSSAR